MHATAESEVLQTLNLSWNHIRKKGAKALAAGLKVSTSAPTDTHCEGYWLFRTIRC